MNHAMSASEMAIMQNENAELRAQVNVLREAMKYIVFVGEGQMNDDKSQLFVEVNKTDIKKCKKALNKTPTQCLAEHDKRVIAEFRAKCVKAGTIYMKQQFADGATNTKFEKCVAIHNENRLKTGTVLYTLPPIDNEEK